MGVENIAQLLVNHPLVPKISRIFYFFIYMLVVVECDLPWDSDAVESHGINFTPWTEDHFKRLLKTLSTNLINPYAFVVYHARSQDLFIKKWSNAQGFSRIHDCYLWKFGILLIISYISYRCWWSNKR